MCFSFCCWLWEATELVEGGALKITPCSEPYGICLASNAQTPDHYSERKCKLLKKREPRKDAAWEWDFLDIFWNFRFLPKPWKWKNVFLPPSTPYSVSCLLSQVKGSVTRRKEPALSKEDIIWVSEQKPPHYSASGCLVSPDWKLRLNLVTWVTALLTSYLRHDGK